MNKGLENKYGNILSEFDTLYSEFASVNIQHRNFIEMLFITNELMNMTLGAYQMEQLVTGKPEEFEKAISSSPVSQLKRGHKTTMSVSMKMSCPCTTKM